jgi:hypothetical protein
VIGANKAREQAELSFKKKEQRLKEGEQANAEYLAEQRRVRENTLRLRALRLARDAAMKHPIPKGR